jgi:hypothetical protein
MKYQVTVARDCWELKHCVTLSDMVGREGTKHCFVSVYRVYSVNVDNGFIWKCQVQYNKISSEKNESPTFLDTTRATLKTTRPTILRLLRVYLLPQ